MALKQPLALVQTRPAVDPFATYFTPVHDLAPGGTCENPAVRRLVFPDSNRDAVKGSVSGHRSSDTIRNPKGLRSPNIGHYFRYARGSGSGSSPRPAKISPNSRSISA